MARPLSSTDVDKIARVIHERNVICSRMLLKALQRNHGVVPAEEFGPEPQPEPESEPDPKPLSSAIVAELPIVHFPKNKIEQIKRIICERYNLSKADIESDTRQHRIAIPRQIGMYIANLEGYSFPEIGGRFGSKHHTTVLHACRKVARLSRYDEKLARQVAEIRAEIPE